MYFCNAKERKAVVKLHFLYLRRAVICGVMTCFFAYMELDLLLLIRCKLYRLQGW